MPLASSSGSLTAGSSRFEPGAGVPTAGRRSGSGRSSIPAKRPAAMPASSAPRAPAWVTWGQSYGPSTARFTERTAGLRAHPPARTSRRLGPATDSMWARSSAARSATASRAARQTSPGLGSAPIPSSADRSPNTSRTARPRCRRGGCRGPVELVASLVVADPEQAEEPPEGEPGP